MSEPEFIRVASVEDILDQINNDVVGDQIPPRNHFGCTQTNFGATFLRFAQHVTR